MRGGVEFFEGLVAALVESEIASEEELSLTIHSLSVLYDCELEVREQNGFLLVWRQPQ